jgi:diguanylate cyclase (GGDEF)-like protein/PAS domain S-box-containing protein
MGIAMTVEIPLFKEILEKALDAVWVINEDDEIEFVNPAAEKLTGYTQEELLETKFSNLKLDFSENIFLSNPKLILNSVNNSHSKNSSNIKEFQIKTKDDRYILVEMNVFEIQKSVEGKQLFAGIMRDIQFRKSLEESQRMTMATLKKLAFIDELTMIPNRRSFYDSLKKLIASNLRHGRYASLAIVDIDNFKEINDTYGHDVGDLVLRNISKAFIENLREEDTVGRIGGEEFGFLLPETDEDGAYVVLERVRLAVKHYRFFIFENYYLNVTVSIGFVKFGSNQTLEQIIKCADIALYKSKNSGKDTISKF